MYLTRTDADLICTLHNERTHLVSRDAYVEMRDAHEADQQTIADLKQRVDDEQFSKEFAQQKWNECTLALKENMQTIAELRKALVRISTGSSVALPAWEIAKDALAAIAATEGDK
jgi:hypothetical protein